MDNADKNRIFPIEQGGEYLTPEEFFSRGDYPDKLFKYRSWNDPFHRRIISDLEIFLASPSQFEDTNDCKNHVRYDHLSDEDFLIALRHFVQRTSPKWNFEARERQVQELLETNQLRNSDFTSRMAEETYEDWSSRIGILSLSINPNENEMWRKYAEEDKGFCVSFHGNRFLQFVRGGGLVKYVPQLPVIYPQPFHDLDDHIRLQVFHKENRWSFEEEYRTIIFNYTPLHMFQRKIKITPAAYHEIILGRNCGETQMEEIRRLVRTSIGVIQNEMCDENGRTHLIINP